MNAPADNFLSLIEARAAGLEPKIIAWRRDFHAHPELGNQEVRTSGIVAEHLKKLGLDDVRTGVAKTGVVGTLIGGKPGPVGIAHRLDPYLRRRNKGCPRRAASPAYPEPHTRHSA